MLSPTIPDTNMIANLSQVDYFRCPLVYSAKCSMLLQVRRDAHVTEILTKDAHNRDSHAEDRACNINNQQLIGIACSVKATPLPPGSMIIYRSSSFSPKKVIPFSVNCQRAVERYVLIEHDKLFDPIMEGIKLDGKEGTMEQLADALCLTRRIPLHNSGERELGPHDPVCLGSQFSEGVRFMCLSTIHFLTNMPRAKNADGRCKGTSTAPSISVTRNSPCLVSV